MSNIVKYWRELSGEKEWEGLLNPLNIDLRRYLIHYGERTVACENALNTKESSPGFGCSRFPPEGFFSKLGLEKGNSFKYDVTKFFYALSDVSFVKQFVAASSAWMGFVSVTTDEGVGRLGRRDILVCWRGTSTTIEWIKDAQVDMASASQIFRDANDPKVHKGFLTIYNNKNADTKYSKNSAREQILKEVKRLVDLYQNEEISITITGHSLGGALAQLTAMDIVSNEYNKPTGKDKACMVTCFAFASPRVGNKGFQEAFSKLENLHILRVTNTLDIVPNVPPKVLGGYIDMGKELGIDTGKSPYVKPLVNRHDLELYLHGIAGFRHQGEFKLEVARDIVLVNKYLDGLKDEYNVPPGWWYTQSDIMVQQDDGTWKLEKDYVPEPLTYDDISLVH